MKLGSRYACATVVTTSKYVLGALVLGHSIRRSGWKHELAVLVTSDVGPSDRKRLLQVWDRVIEVEPIANPNPPAKLGFHSFATVYTKLRLWEQTDYAKLIYLDADTIVLGDLSDLLDRPDFAAAPCGTAPDQFNSGVLVLDPSARVFEDMTAQLPVLQSYDGGDQGFLNSFYPDWFTGPAGHRLPMIYNVPRLLAFYATAWRRLEGRIKVLHFYGPQKPWQLKDGMAHRVLSRLITTATALEIAQPTPRSLWWDLHRDLEETISRPVPYPTTMELKKAG